ncbi:hypothetical protein HHK36_030425 [Tetracentron sinense]|uniref:F-box protein n=1 Tax=Tetracentron sinense TaxID=13715 RepID=A0A835D1J4_TETSI|nr:hypothetical protein HHK36_030425 [Tetracentron sinense]
MVFKNIHSEDPPEHTNKGKEPVNGGMKTWVRKAKQKVHETDHNAHKISVESSLIKDTDKDTSLDSEEKDLDEIQVDEPYEDLQVRAFEIDKDSSQYTQEFLIQDRVTEKQGEDSSQSFEDIVKDTLVPFKSNLEILEKRKASTQNSAPRRTILIFACHDLRFYLNDSSRSGISFSFENLAVLVHTKALAWNQVCYYLCFMVLCLDLYGKRIRPVAPYASVCSKPVIDLAPIHRCLPDELLFEVFARMNPYSLGRAACVCRKWRYTIRNPLFWRSACLKAWQLAGAVENYKILHSIYEGSWRKMWLLRPRVRTDGLYVSRNTYIRTGIAEWKVSNPVHVVCYFRYMRFFPSGRFLYKNSSQKVKDVAKFMNFRVSKANSVFGGHYTLSDDKVEAAILYPGLRPTVLRIHLRLRGTTAGANNRIDLLSLVTSGVNDSEVNGHDDDVLGVVGGWQENETHNPDVPAVSHTRGLTPFVFIPYEESSNGTAIPICPTDSHWCVLASPAKDLSRIEHGLS